MSHSNFFCKNIFSIRYLITIIVLIQFSLIVSFGQAQTIDITVKVIDGAGAVVPGAKVTITKKDSAQSFTQTTDEEGRVNFRGIEPGIYNIRVDTPGFKTAMRSDVAIAIGQTTSFEIVLSAPGVTDLVTVTASAEEPSEQILSALPNFNNDLTPLLQVTVGAIPSGSSQLGRVIIDGKGKDTTAIRLDGIDATPQVDLPSADPSLDIIDSFQKPGVAFNSDNPGTVSKAFAPEFGPGTGVIFNNSTLRADGTWRAQFNIEHLNNAFNARNFFDYFGKNGIQRTRFGGKAGGPLDSSNRSLLYFAYEGVRGRTERTFFEAVPLEAVCRCGISGVLGALLGNYLPDNTVVLPNRSLNPGFLVAQRRGRTVVEANSFDIRFDREITPEMALTFRYTPQLATNFVPDGITGRRQKQKISFHNFLTSFSFLTQNSFLSTVRFGLNNTRVQVNSENPAALSPELTKSVINLSGSVNTTLPGGISVPVATIGSLIKGIGRGYDLDPKSFSLSYDASAYLEPDKHQIFFGVESRFIRLGFDRLGGISYSFSNLESFRAGMPTSTNFLSDLSGPSPFSDLTGRRHARQNYFLSYIQFRSQLFNKKLTLTYGLRYDYFGGVNERDDRVFLIDPETGVVLPPGAPLIRAQKNNFQPRFGLAYSLSDEGFFKDTVVKLGAGIYSGSPRIGDLILPIESDRLNTTINGGDFTVGIDDILRNFREQPQTRQFQPLAFSRNYNIPERLYKWEASLKKPVKNIYDLIFSYTGNVGRDLPIALVGNQIVNVLTNPDPTKPAIIVREFDVLAGGQILKPFGEFFYRSSDGKSNYNALSVQMKTNGNKESSLPDWLKFNVLSIQYTYSLNKGNTSGTIVSDPFDIDSDYGFNSADIRHSFSFQAVYRIWEAAGKSNKRSSLLWGWQIAPSLTARSGLPLIIRIDRPDVVYIDGSGNVFSAAAVGRTATVNVPGGGGAAGTQVPDLIPNVNPYSSDNRLTLLNPQAFAIPQPGSFGNLQRGQLRGPNYVSLDLSISRFLFSNDRFGTELRVDFFNIFNRANFINPTVSLPNALGINAEANQIQPGTSFNRLSAGAFGIVTAADFGRRVQFSLTFKLNRGFLGKD